MKASLALALISALSALVTGQTAGTAYPFYQKNGQIFTLQSTTPTPHTSTMVSLSPQTSVSVQHTIVRNRPAYPYPYTETTLQSDGSEDSSYYYTYEDTSEESNDKYTTTPVPTTSTAKSTVRSFWNSQKAQLDARRKENSQKLLPTYNRPTPKAESKPKVEFKIREKPKFGLANRNKELTTTPASGDEYTSQVQTTTQKSVKNNNVEANLAIEKSPMKDDSNKVQEKGTNPNQIVGRIGEIPVSNKFSTQIQPSVQAQNKKVNRFGASRQSKFDESVATSKLAESIAKLQQPALKDALNSLAALASNKNQQPALSPEQFLMNLNKQQLPLSSNKQQSSVNQQFLTSNLQGLLNSKQNQQQLPNTNQQSLLSLFLNNQQTSKPNAFVVTSPAVDTAARSSEALIDSTAGSGFLSRLGALALGGGGDGLLLERDGGYGGGNGLTFNLGPVPDPLTILLKLLSLIPRPLLDLNGRIFFGIELGKNAGLVSGAVPKPGIKPIG
ncbi:uncharacterized protein LOC129981953 [Argiope bruennichi]|uniref:Uncharacterized protein n=1 Tax=Argiope bruennichi TaxID=94029 RepID=A0A8T0G159_ARGBR|nr:uncharacterized protein LOC129981953 [Argiope bruennichi]KAF8796188.1 hypothetical protein HNY73_000600 [Argiope bruennichi]